MVTNLNKILENTQIEASAPCRVDMGGTLDISTFYLPLRHLNPCTFNIAIALRTRVRLYPYRENYVRIVSKGFETAEYPTEYAPFKHPLGLMFAVAAFFRSGGVSIEIDSASPPKSALGGSSVAASALTAALLKARELEGTFKKVSKNYIPLIAHQLEACVAGVPCGIQDQLAAVYGGVNAWYWQEKDDPPFFRKRPVIRKPSVHHFEKKILLAYCGIPHESKNINKIWVDQFLSGTYRDIWKEIITCTHGFIDSIQSGNTKLAVEQMNRETDLRRILTPDVVDTCGVSLIESAKQQHCAARFTGAGGGGCIWAFGTPEDILRLKPHWSEILNNYPNACLLPSNIDSDGLKVSIPTQPPVIYS